MSALTPEPGRAPRGPQDAPRRLLTDWTTTAGLGGDGLAALVVGDDAVPEAVHLATLGYATFLVGSATPDTDLPSTVHAVDVEPRAVPSAWHDRFALVVAGPHDLPAWTACLAPAGLLVVLGDEGAVPETPPAGLTEVTRESGPDPAAPTRIRVRAVHARL